MSQHTSQNWDWVPAGDHLTTVNLKKDKFLSDLISTLHFQKTELQRQNDSFFSTLTQLEASIPLYEDIFEFAPIGFFILDKNGIIQRANTRAEAQLRLDKALMIGRDFSEFLNGTSTKNSFLTHMEQSMKDQKIIQLQCEIKRKDQTTFPGLVKSIVLKNNLGGFKHMFTILTDISKVKEHEYQVEAALAKSEHLNEILSGFISIASHEFRTPLSAVLSSNSLVEKYAKLGQTEMMQKHISRIKSSVKVMVGIMEEFLSLERLENGQIEIEYSKFNLNKFCEDIVEELQAQAKTGQKIIYSGSGNAEIVTDRKALQHILMNLLSNACKYSGENSEIQFITDVNDYRVQINIHDNGIGIPQPQHEKIFTRFFRARNAVAINGTGLGLYICKRYVELLNGTISFTSEINKGTIFKVEIPQTIN